MRSPEDVSEREPWSPVEVLLREAAEFEPESPPPGLLTAGSVALLLSEDAARHRRSAGARVAGFAALLAGGAACSAALGLAFHAPAAKDQHAQAPLTTPAKHQPALIKPPAERPRTVASKPQVPPVRRLASSRSTPRRQHAQPTRAVPTQVETPPVWTEETVDHQVLGVLAPAWLVEPQEDGSVAVTPTLIDVPLEATAATCEPGPEPVLEAASPSAENLETNEARY